MRFLPEKYEQENNIPFDLRGLIQLNSGIYPNGQTVNDYGHIKGRNKVYPDSVKGIEIDQKANKIHFLVGAIFAGNMTTGSLAASLKINYEDGASESLELVAGTDIFEWWQADSIEELPSEKIGWVGVNNLGNKRGFTKPSWTNPNPSKLISHIDFISGKTNGAPFLIAITLE